MEKDTDSHGGNIMYSIGNIANTIITTRYGVRFIEVIN